MKKLILAVLFLCAATVSYADQWVNGYTRRDGTQVQGYYRSDSNGSVRDNYSYKGNVNPHTGSTGDNYYRNSPTSEYYGSSSSGRESPSYSRSLVWGE